MKPFLGVDVTLDKKNQQSNGCEFLIQAPSAALTDTLTNSLKKTHTTLEKSKLPLPLRIIQIVCGIAALLISVGILRADVSVIAAYKNAPWLFWVDGICAAIWLILFLWSQHKSKTVLQSEEGTRTFAHLEGSADAIYHELSVPDCARNIDILSFFYKVKNGEVKLVEKAFKSQYSNPEYKIFTDEENLYLANTSGKFAFPLSAIQSVQTVKKHITIADWNKDEAYNTGIYKQYKLSKDDFGYIHCKQFHIVEISHWGQTYGIYIPSYELPTLEDALKQKIANNLFG